MKRLSSSYKIRLELVKGSALFDVYNDTVPNRILKDGCKFTIYSNTKLINLENITYELPNSPTPTRSIKRSSSVGRQQIPYYNESISTGKVFYTRSMCDEDIFYIIAIFPKKADDFVIQIKNDIYTKLYCDIQELLNRLIVKYDTIPAKNIPVIKRRRSGTPRRR